MEINRRPQFPLIHSTSNKSAVDTHPHQSAAPPLALYQRPTPHLTHPTMSSIRQGFVIIFVTCFYFYLFCLCHSIDPLSLVIAYSSFFLFGHVILSRIDYSPLSFLLCFPFGYIIFSQPTLCSIFIFHLCHPVLYVTSSSHLSPGIYTLVDSRCFPQI
jgi:hypothetical protein